MKNFSREVLKLPEFKSPTCRVTKETDYSVTVEHTSKSGDKVLETIVVYESYLTDFKGGNNDL